MCYMPPPLGLLALRGGGHVLSDKDPHASLSISQHGSLGHRHQEVTHFFSNCCLLGVLSVSVCLLLTAYWKLVEQVTPTFPLQCRLWV